MLFVALACLVGGAHAAMSVRFTSDFDAGTEISNVQLLNEEEGYGECSSSGTGGDAPQFLLHGGKNFGFNGIEFECAFTVTYPDGNSCDCKYGVDMSIWLGSERVQGHGLLLLLPKDHPSTLWDIPNNNDPVGEAFMTESTSAEVAPRSPRRASGAAVA
ncbi:hypothetical protein JL722_15156 [Aureococcus anophagefferens]|nr:hypothetical protein JL722_15156 [Aureococcus anophagefferens]